MDEIQLIESRLWNYIDGGVDPEEKKRIEQLLDNNEIWRCRYHELLQFHATMREDFELDHPSMRFSKNVMDEIAHLKVAPATKSYINKRIINGIAGLFLVMIAGLLIYGFAMVDWNSIGAGRPAFDISKIDVTRYFNKTSIDLFLMLNIVLALVLLDRMLSKKRAASKNHQH
jgi:hypothetical protein